ncbi:MAG: insulinase family protein [Planctomycetes bacterium]|nr:insulinase family protein [Planctomycetota bacterium]MCB9919567.1 insulinase family protein [Planctomycetota bacterium]
MTVAKTTTKARSRTTTTGRLALDIHRRVLPNGLTLLATRNRAAPTIAIRCQLEVGRLNEPGERAGIASMLGDCLDEGTEKHSGDELAEIVEGLGGSLRCGSSGAMVRFAAEDTKAAIDILAEVVRTPTFPSVEVRRAKSLALADIAADDDNPSTVAFKCYRELCYGTHPFARDAKGTRETIDTLTSANLRAFHKKWFTPDNARIAAVGDLDPEEMLDLLTRAFSSWKGKAPIVEAFEMPANPPAPVHQHIRFDREQAHVYLGHLGVTRHDDDYYKLVVMDHILGSGPGFTSRITRKLRDEQGLCYSVFAGISGSADRERGLFTAYIGTSPGKEAVAIEGFLEEMRAIRETLPTETEIADVKAYLTGSFVWALERNSNLAAFLLRSERFGLGDDFVARYPDLIESVTRADVRDAAERHLDPDHYYLVTLGRGESDAPKRSVSRKRTTKSKASKPKATQKKKAKKR